MRDASNHRNLTEPRWGLLSVMWVFHGDSQGSASRNPGLHDARPLALEWSRIAMQDPFGSKWKCAG